MELENHQQILKLMSKTWIKFLHNFTNLPINYLPFTKENNNVITVKPSGHHLHQTIKIITTNVRINYFQVPFDMTN